MTDEGVEYGSVVISDEGIAEYDGPRRAIFVPRPEVEEVEVVRTSEVARPWLSVVVGIAVVLGSLVPLWPILALMRDGGILHLRRWTVAIPVALFLGLYMIWSGLRKRLVLVVRTRRGQRKLAFQGAVDSGEAVQFVRDTAARFGYPTGRLEA